MTFAASKKAIERNCSMAFLLQILRGQVLSSELLVLS